MLIDYLQNNAIQLKNKEAIICINSSEGYEYRETLTWYEFNNIANQISYILLKNQITRGDRVAIILSNCLEWLPIYFSILKIGGIAVPINYNNSVEEICDSLEFAECSCAFIKCTSPKWKNIACRLEDKVLLFFVGEEELISRTDLKKRALQNSVENPNMHISDNDSAAIYFSSGTTGRSKAVLLSHGALSSNAHTELRNHRQQTDEKFLCIAPLYHTGAKIHWFGSLIVGGAIVINNISSPMKIANVIEEEKIGIVWLMVPQMQDILTLIENKCISKNQFRSLRLVHSGAQPIPIELVRRWKMTFEDVSYDISYGLTEASGPGCIDLGIGTTGKDGSIGKLSEGWNAIIVDENGNLTNKEEIGELLIKGPGVMKEYYKDSIATSQALANGWLHTGDIAYKDSDDYFYIVDRKKDVIISGGENVYPVQIENYLRKYSGIKDVAVIGIPNPRLGESLAAIIELSDDSKYSKRDIYKLCEGLPSYKRPLRILFAPIVRSTTGKINRRAMRSLYDKENQ